MQKNQTNAPAGGFGVQDVLFVLCKHKWMIILLALLGFAAAAVVYVKQKPIYRSTAKLLVRYVVETAGLDPYSQLKSPGDGAGGGGSSVILTEVEILNSMDLSLEVAREIGPGRLLPEAAGAGEVPLADAAGTVLGNLEVNLVSSPNVLHVTYGNEKRELSKEVLDKIMEVYFRKHLEIHRSAAAFDEVAKETEEVRRRLKQTETELNLLRTDSGILSLKDATGALSSQKSRTLEELMNSKAELAEQRARIQSLEQSAGISSQVDQPATPSGKPDTSPGDDAATAIPASPVPPQIVTEYRALVELLGFLQKRDLELRVKFKSGNRLIAQNQGQIANYDQKRLELIRQYPGLTSEAAVTSAETGDPGLRLDMEKARLAALTAKIGVFETHLEEIARQFGEQYSIGARIEEIERRKQMEEVEYRSLEVKLKEAKLRAALDPSRMPNITIVQQPSEPVKTFDKLTMKIIMGLAAGGLALGLGIAFLIELVFNRKIERPIEIQARLQLPLLLSIPFVRRSGRGGLLLGSGDPASNIEGGAEEWEAASRGSELLVSAQPAKPSHFMMPFSQTIRDRIIFNFEVNNVLHKPKLIAVTAMSEGAGASTIAAGLAKSFSEIRNAKVLLVDLSSFHPHDNPVFGEIPRHSLPVALRLAQDSDFRERPQNLYYANASARRDVGGLSQFTPLHLHEMMPLMHASEYDYIIFDMPAVTQTSPTLTMAGLMDKVLLVLDAENTSREGLKWGYSELTRGRADVSCIFNKTRTHGPDWLIGAH